MTSRNNSPEQWERELIERQHNLTPATMTRSSQFRGSGLPRTARLPIALRWKYIWFGAALFVLGIGIRLVFNEHHLPAIGGAVGAAGLFVMLSGIRWTTR
jgi:hypothetical protein